MLQRVSSRLLFFFVDFGPRVLGASWRCRLPPQRQGRWMPHAQSASAHCCCCSLWLVLSGPQHHSTTWHWRCRPRRQSWRSGPAYSRFSSFVGLRASSLSLALSWALSWVCFSAGTLKPRANGKPAAAAAQPTFSLPLVSAILLQGRKITQWEQSCTATSSLHTGTGQSETSTSVVQAWNLKCYCLSNFCIMTLV